jgi:hypothetical protein
MVPSEYYSGNNNLLSLYNKVATLVQRRLSVDYCHIRSPERKRGLGF